MKRRDFLKTSVTASAVAALADLPLKSAAAGAEGANAARDFYELRAYHLKEGASHELLDSYLEKAALPALNRAGAKPIGVFAEQEPKDGEKTWVLITYPSLEAFSAATARVAADADYQKAGAEYLALPKDKPGFDRIDSWFLLAFSGMPRIELPPYSRDGFLVMFTVVPLIMGALWFFSLLNEEKRVTVAAPRAAMPAASNPSL